MQPTDKPGFAEIIAKTWRFYGKQPTGDDLADWFELLEGFPLEAVAVAFKRHLTDPKAGQYLPKPADIIRHLPIPKPEDDGRPSPDEAWGQLLRLVRNEAETGVLSDEIRHGWQVCGSILDAGDEIGARKCFLAAYGRAVDDARQRGIPPHWTVTLGTDPQLRRERIAAAVQRGQIGRDHAMALLPGPSAAAIDGVAGLLAGPEASEQDRKTSQRLRSLADALRAAMAVEEAKDAASTEARRAQRDAEARQKQAIGDMVDQAEQQRNVGGLAR